MHRLMHLWLICSTGLHITHSCVTWYVVYCVLDYDVIPNIVAVTEKSLSDYHIPSLLLSFFYPLAPFSSHLYFRRDTEIHLSLRLALIYHKILHTQITTFLSANCAPNILKLLQYDKTIATFL